MNKGLFTYTTTIEPQSTIAEIQEMLVKHGARSIMTNYSDNGKIESLSFAIEVKGKSRGIRLPCDPIPVLKVLQQQVRERKISPKFAEEHQALRVAWRIVHYWIKAQMAILETQMVKMEQIFLPYMVTRDGKTLFETMEQVTRVQRKRTKGWRMPENTVYVGRPSKWGNPFKTADEFQDWLYRAGTIQKDGVYGAGAGYRLAVMTELPGKNLACWCSLDRRCHADVLFELANGRKSR